MSRKTVKLPQHLLTMETLNREQINRILQRANYYLKNFVKKNRTCRNLSGKIVANLFFEPSTRTLNSFEIAAKRLGALVLSPTLQTSSIIKGETLLDTVQTLAAMGANTFVIRHAENGICHWLAEKSVLKSTFINAGDGSHQHPTQALTDLFTIQQHKKNWSTLNIAIIGDILHSRVAHSLINGLLAMKVANIHLIGPVHLIPTHLNDPCIKIFHSLPEGLSDSDVIVALRLQKERMQQQQIPDFTNFHQQFGLTDKILSLTKPDSIVMHPGPINREIEIASRVADGPRSVILQQVQNGVAIRMAVFDLFCH